MAQERNGELVQRFYAGMQAGNIEGVLALLSRDFELVYSGPSIIPCAGRWSGHEGFRNWTQAAMQGHLPPDSVDFGEFTVHDDKVFVPGHVRLRVKTTGKTCETDFLHVFTVRDGRLTRWHDFFDTFALAQAYTR
jgi:ketosteroid isomerase-like protein